MERKRDHIDEMSKVRVDLGEQARKHVDVECLVPGLQLARALARILHQVKHFVYFICSPFLYEK